MLSRRTVRTAYRPAAPEHDTGEARVAALSASTSAPARADGLPDRPGPMLCLRLDEQRHTALLLASQVSGLSPQQLARAAIDFWLGFSDSQPQTPPAGA